MAVGMLVVAVLSFLGIAHSYFVSQRRASLPDELAGYQKTAATSALSTLQGQTAELAQQNGGVMLSGVYAQGDRFLGDLQAFTRRG